MPELLDPHNMIKMNRHKPYTLLLLLVMSWVGIHGQMSSNTQAYWIHEDVVKPSMVGEYETVVKELVANMKKHSITEANFLVTNTDDNRYLYVGPIENMAQLDKPVFNTLADKMGGDAMTALFNRMDKCYDIEHNYIIHLDKDLSYMPAGITQTPEGRDYRKFHYLHITPANRSTVKAKMQAVKELFTAKDSPMHYRVYKSGFGTRGEFYMVAVAAKDAIDLAQMAKANEELLGEEGHAVFSELFANLLKYEGYEGRMRPDLYYRP